MKTFLQKICISPKMSIKEAVKALNDGQQKIVMIVEPDGKLLGIVADSDIRRAILNGIPFDYPVEKIMVTNPVVSSPVMNDKEVLSLMGKSGCYEIPVLDSNRKVVDLKSIDLLLDQKPQHAEIVIMAGGLGTRLKPLTDVKPKPLITIAGKPILFILLDQLIMAGFQKITITINYKAEMIKEAINAIPGYSDLVQFIEEKERMGTAGALSLLEKTPDSPFFVMNADLLTKVDFSAMLRFHKIEKNQITIAVREEFFQIPFGVLDLNNREVLGIKEKPSHTYFVNAGIYILDPVILSKPFENTFYDMPDLINDSIASGKKVGSFPIHEYWLDIGRHDELRHARKNNCII
jgi:dTDP-glucose pyrophosphorylase